MLAFSCLSLFAQTGPQSLNVSGVLFEPSGAVISQNGVSFRLEVWDKAATCILYTETHSAQDLSTSKGGFSLELGKGSSPTNYLESSSTFTAKIFQNTGAVAGGWANCASGTNLASGDERLIRIYYDLGSGYVAMSPDVPITASAYAMVAESVQGKSAADLIQVKDDATTDLNQANVENVFSSTNYARLQQLLNPTASLSFGSQRLTNLANPTSAQDAATKNYADTKLGGQTIDLVDVAPGFGGGKVLTWDSAQNKWVAQAPTLAGSAGGDLTGTYPNPTIAAAAIGTSKMANDAVTSAKINSTGIATNRLLITDATTGATVTYATCANNEILRFVTGTGWQCTTVSTLAPVTSVAGRTGAVTLSATDVSGLGTAATRNIGTAMSDVPELLSGGKLGVSTIPLFLGDVTGSVDANVVTRLQGRDVASTAPNANEVLRWNGSRWEPQALTDNGITALTGDISASGNGSVAATLTNGVVTTPKVFTNPGTNRLVATDGTSGATLVPFSCNLNEIMQWGASGWACASVSTAMGGSSIVNNGNSFGAAMTVGTNDAQVLHLETNDSPRLTILSNGNVGIGTTTPTSTFDVNGSIRVGLALQDRTVTSNQILLRNNQIDTNGLLVGASDSLNLLFDTDANGTGTLNIRAQNTNASLATPILTAMANGNVGVGVTTPSSMLDVAGNLRVGTDATITNNFTVGGLTTAPRVAGGSAAGSSLRLYSTSGAGTSDYISLFTGSSAERLRIDTDGNVGVGTTSPARLLDVAGAIHLEPTSLPGTPLAGDLAFDSGAGNSLKYHNGSAWVSIGSGTGDFMKDGSVAMIGALRATAGSASAPGYTFVGDTDNGIFAPASDVLAIATAGSEWLRVTSTGLVGIGTTNPGRWLDVAGPVRVQPATLPASPTAGDLAFDSGASNALKFHNGSSWVTVGSGNGDFLKDGSVAMTGNFRLNNNWLSGDGGNEGIFVDSTGKVGLGTSSPGYQLDVVNLSAGATIGLTSQTNAASNSAFIGLRARDSAGAAAAVQANDTLVSLSARGHIGSGWPAASSGSIGLVAEETFSSSARGTQIRFYTTAPTTANILQRMVITGSGNVGIGTTGPGRLLEVAGPMRITPATLPSSPTAGDIAFDSGASNALKYHDGSNWISLTASSSGDFKADGTVPMTAALRAVAGSASAPGLTFVGDTGNGIFAPAADTLAIGTAGSERLRIGSTGNVGIGTTSPGFPLDISTISGGVSPLIVLQGPFNSSGVGTALKFRSTGAVDYAMISGVRGSASNNGYMSFTVQSTGAWVEAMRLDQTGYLGIGTTTPTRMLDVAGAMHLTPGALPGTPAAGDLAFDSGAANALKFHNGSSWVTLGSSSGDFMKDGSVAMTGALLAIGGSAPAPGYSFSGDSNTGLFSPAADTLALGTSGIERLRVSAAGLLGIGSTSPSNDISFGASSSRTIGVERNTAGGTGYGLSLAAGGATSGATDQAGGNLTLSSGTSTGSALSSIYFQVPSLSGSGTSDSAPATTMTIYNGKVGIGITNPSRPLVISATGTMGVQGVIDVMNSNSTLTSSSSVNLIHLANNGGNTVVNSIVGDFKTSIADSGGNKINTSSISTTATNVTNGSVTGTMAFQTAVNSSLVTGMTIVGSSVGIGTTSPARSLHVNGPIRVQPAALPSSPTAGDLAFDSGSSNTLKFHNGSSWVTLGAGGGDFMKDGSVAMTGAHLAIGGSAPAPGYSFSGDTDNGIFAPAADVTAIGTNGVERMRVAANGSVGIGTTNPSYMLDVYGGAASISRAGIGTTSTEGLLLTNPTPGALGAPQYSPRLHFHSSGYDTTNSLTKDYDYIMEAQAVSTTASASTPILVISRSISGSAYSTMASWDQFGNFTNAGNISGAQFNGSNTFTKTGASLGTTSSDGFVTTNGTAATVGVPVQMAPRLRFNAKVWDTGSAASRAADWTIENLPTSGNPGTANLLFGYAYNSGSYSYPMALTSAGNLGIGTTAPIWKLVVAGGAASQLITTTDFALGSTGTDIAISTGANTGNTYGVIQVGTTGAVGSGALALNPNGGNVGVGTTNPIVTLDVNGTARALQTLETVYHNSSASGTIAVSLVNGTDQQFTTSGNLTLTLPAPLAGSSYSITIKYGGAHTITFNGGGTIKWPGGTVPTATSVSGKYDIYNCKCDATATYTFCSDGGRNY